MGLLADMARKEFMKKASEGFDKIDLKVYEEIILPLEENIDLYAEKSDQIIETQEAVLVALYRSLKNIRPKICQDYGEIIPNECKDESDA